ncbi:MAG TPA: ribosome maturation factor RimM [Polyangiaceae bacterium]
MPEQRLEIGRLGAPHGLAGELSVKPYFEGSDALLRAPRVWLVKDDEAREFVVEGARQHGQRVLMKLGGIGDRTAAERFTGARLEMERSLLPPLAPGEYYLIDLIGADVVGPEGPVGRVTRVLAHPSVDAIEIALADGRTAEQPLVAPFLARVDAPARRIELASLDGLVL